MARSSQVPTVNLATLGVNEPQTEWFLDTFGGFQRERRVEMSSFGAGLDRYISRTLSELCLTFSKRSSASLPISRLSPRSVTCWFENKMAPQGPFSLIEANLGLLAIVAAPPNSTCHPLPIVPFRNCHGPAAMSMWPPETHRRTSECIDHRHQPSFRTL
jgi:hypothetical protein